MNINLAVKILLLILLAAPHRLVWRVGEPLPEAEGGAAAGILGRDLVLAGGTTWKNGKKLVLRDVQIYSIPDNRWREGPPLPVAVADAAFLTSGAGLDVIGGYDGVNTSKKWWHLDAGKTAWTGIGEIPEPRIYETAG